MRVRIHYVEGDELEVDPERWSVVRADGVDWFEVITDTGSVRFEGNSLYWLYERDGVWYAGGCGIGYPNQLEPVELVITDGVQSTRPFVNVPDLYHAETKLGWWWPIV